jgi:ribosome-associated protein
MALAALEAKAEDVVVLDFRKVSFSFDFFVLSSAASDRRIQTVADRIEERLEALGLRLRAAEGERHGGWVLLDYGSVVGHIFDPELRKFYGLERLWADAPRVALPKNRRS